MGGPKQVRDLEIVAVNRGVHSHHRWHDPIDKTPKLPKLPPRTLGIRSRNPIKQV